MTTQLKESATMNVHLGKTPQSHLPLLTYLKDHSLLPVGTRVYNCHIDIWGLFQDVQEQFVRVNAQGRRMIWPIEFTYAPRPNALSVFQP